MGRTFALIFVSAFLFGIIPGVFIADDITGAMVVQPSYIRIEPATAAQLGMTTMLNLIKLQISRSGSLKPYYPPKYLIISEDTLYNTAEQLAQHRRSNFQVAHRNISQIGSTSSALRQYIKAYASSNPRLKYVLLVGNVSLIPTFYYNDGALQIPTDFNYSNVKTEAMVPDFVVARIPASTPSELQIVIDKIKAFDGRSANDLLLFGHGTEMDVYGSKQTGMLRGRGFNVTAVNKTGNQNNDLQIAVSTLNAGRDVAAFYGHAGLFFMYPFSGHNLPSISGRIFVLLSGGCETMNFANNQADISIAYLFMKKGYAAAAIGASRNGGYGYAYKFVDGFFDRNVTTAELGDRFLYAMKYEINVSLQAGGGISGDPYQYSKRLALLGDPAMKFRVG